MSFETDDVFSICSAFVTACISGVFVECEPREKMAEAGLAGDGEALRFALIFF
jgi:hypothetical protein